MYSMKNVLKKKRYLWIVLAISIVLLLVFVFSRRNSEAYTRYQVVRTDVSDELLLAGDIDAVDRVDLGFAVSGRVKKNNIAAGEYVKKGQVIAEIEQNRLVSDLVQAEANYTLTRVDTSTSISSATDSLEKQLQEQNALVDGLYREYLSGDLQAYLVGNESRQISAPTITGTYENLEQGEYVLEVYSSNSDSGYSYRLSGLDSGRASVQEYQPGALGNQGLYIQFDPASSYRNTQWVVPVPNIRSATYSARKRAYETAVATRDRIITDAQNNVDKIAAADTQTSLTRDQALRSQARAQVNAVYAQLGDGKITAPFDGLVVKNNLEVGEIVNAFTPQVVLINDTAQKIELEVPEIYIGKIAVGDQVSILLDVYPDKEINGLVTFIDVIDTEVNGVPVYKTTVDLDVVDPEVRIGMNARARIVTDQVEDVVAIPAHYVEIDSSGQEYVNIETQENPLKIEQRNIQTGLRGNDGLVEVVSGLSEGEYVIFLEQ